MCRLQHMTLSEGELNRFYIRGVCAGYRPRNTTCRGIFAQSRSRTRAQNLNAKLASNTIQPHYQDLQANVGGNGNWLSWAKFRFERETALTEKQLTLHGKTVFSEAIFFFHEDSIGAPEIPTCACWIVQAAQQ